MQVVLILMVNNAFLLLAVADIDFFDIALYGGWGLIVIAGIYLARATEEVNNGKPQYRTASKSWEINQTQTLNQ